MEDDIFTNKSDSYNPQTDGYKKNFFINSQNIYGAKEQNQGKRLNDLDFNILKEDAYKKINNDRFKLEYQISKSEEDIREVEKQLQAAKDINDFKLAQTLLDRKLQLEFEMKELVEQYKSSNIPDRINQNSVGQLNAIKNTILNLKGIFTSKLPTRISSLIELKNSLSKLENISKSVDELMTMQVPYGEASDRYEQLSKYIVKANAIQSSIAKHLK